MSKREFDHWSIEGNETMRYVIGICLVTGFLVWDAASNNGRYLEYAVKELKRITMLVGA